jgi:hypothetical protein
MQKMRILLAFEDDYRVYRDVVGAGIRILRPHAEVETASLDALRERIKRFDPDLVICSGHEVVDSDSRLAWVDLSVDPTRPAKVSVGGRHSELTNSTLEALLVVIDDVEELIQKNNDLTKN